MDKITVAKFAARFVVSAGVSSIVHAIIKNNVQPETTIATVKVAAGSLVLGSMISEAAKKHTNEQIDEIVATIAKVKIKLHEAKTEDQK